MPHAHGHDAHGHPAAGPDHGHPHGHDHGHARAPDPCGHGCGAADPRPHGRPDAVPLAPSVEQGADLRTELRIQQMDCPTEEALIRKALSALPAVRSLDFNLMRRVLTVVHAPDALESILRAIRDLGFTPEQAGEAAAPAGMAPEAPGPWWPLAASGAAALAAEAAHW
ncbi:cation transporter, partial [Castellaniella defragrans]